MTVWIVLWDGETKDICTSKENAISTAKNFLAAELEDTFVRIKETPIDTCIYGYHHTIVISEQETDLWT